MIQMADIKELVKKLDADQETAYQAEKALRELVARASAPGREAARDEAAQALAAELNAKQGEKRDQPVHSARARSKVASLLGFVMTGDALMALMSSLRDLDVRESARCALDFYGTQAATKALILALDEVGPEFRVGVVGALGRRRTPEALRALQDAARDDSDEQVRLAAVDELANFAEPANDEIISQGGRGRRSRGRILSARLHLAATLRQAGQSAEANRIYRSIQSGEAAPHHKRAAELGLKETTSAS
jgi:HEAT repeat protein